MDVYLYGRNAALFFFCEENHKFWNLIRLFFAIEARIKVNFSEKES